MCYGGRHITRGVHYGSLGLCLLIGLDVPGLSLLIGAIVVAKWSHCLGHFFLLIVASEVSFPPSISTCFDRVARSPGPSDCDNLCRRNFLLPFIRSNWNLCAVPKWIKTKCGGQVSKKNLLIITASLPNRQLFLSRRA